MPRPCPECQRPDMDEGSVTLKKSIADWLIFGLGVCELFFRAGEGKAKRVLLYGHSRKAFHCPACGTLIIDGASR